MSNIFNYENMRSEWKDCIICVCPRYNWGSCHDLRLGLELKLRWDFGLELKWGWDLGWALGLGSELGWASGVKLMFHISTHRCRCGTLRIFPPTQSLLMQADCSDELWSKIISCQDVCTPGALCCIRPCYNGKGREEKEDMIVNWEWKKKKRSVERRRGEGESRERDETRRGKREKGSE